MSHVLQTFSKNTSYTVCQSSMCFLEDFSSSVLFAKAGLSFRAVTQMLVGCFCLWLYRQFEITIESCHVKTSDQTTARNLFCDAGKHRGSNYSYGNCFPLHYPSANTVQASGWCLRVWCLSLEMHRLHQIRRAHSSSSSSRSLLFHRRLMQCTLQKSVCSVGGMWLFVPRTGGIHCMNF